MIACISPNPFLIDETMTTLNYAMRAQGIKKKIVKNEVDCEEKEEFLCLKCKKSSKVEQDNNLFEERKLEIQALRERPSSSINMRSSLDLSSAPKNTIDKNKVQQKMQLLQSLY